MKKIIIIPLFVLIVSACNNNSIPYEVDTETLDYVQERVSESFMPISISDDYEKENIIITNICQAEHPMGHDNVDYIFQYTTDDNEYESDVAIYEDENEVGKPGQYEVIDGTCEAVNYQ